MCELVIHGYDSVWGATYTARKKANSLYPRLKTFSDFYYSSSRDEGRFSLRHRPGDGGNRIWYQSQEMAKRRRIFTTSTSHSAIVAAAQRSYLRLNTQNHRKNVNAQANKLQSLQPQWVHGILLSKQTALDCVWNGGGCQPWRRPIQD